MIINPTIIFVITFTSYGSTQYTCNLNGQVIGEIASYRPTVERILDEAINGNFKGKTYEQVALLVVNFGTRLTGSAGLENSIDYMLNKSKSAGLDNVHGETVTVPHWVRGAEWANITQPHNKPITILGLGTSIATPPEGMLVSAIVVRSFDELNQRAAEAKGKFVVFNQPWQGYENSVQYIRNGSAAASSVGAVGALIRSVTDFSLYTPHTGWQIYNPNITRTPAACITVEDANYMQRLQDLSIPIQIYLKMEGFNHPSVTSRNTIFDLQGTQNPDKVVVVSGHLDSWDVGDGVVNNGGGALISYGALALLRSLNLRPRRTVRGILWTGGEFGNVGAKSYASAHANEINNFIFFLESYRGTFRPVGFEYSSANRAGCILREIFRLVDSVGATQATKVPSTGFDIKPWTDKGYPGASLLTRNCSYFWYHNSPADHMIAMDPGNLDKNAGIFAAIAYVIADLSFEIPKN